MRLEWCIGRGCGTRDGAAAAAGVKCFFIHYYRGWSAFKATGPNSLVNVSVENFFCQECFFLEQNRLFDVRSNISAPFDGNYCSSTAHPVFCSLRSGNVICFFLLYLFLWVNVSKRLGNFKFKSLLKFCVKSEKITFFD